jgi:hypothetical protein
MELADYIRLGQAAPGLRFLVIGAYAVAAHGHTRATFDVDFLVRRLEREVWSERLAGAGLHRHGESVAFAQFVSAEGADGLDLMFVDDRTFEPMWEASSERDLGGARARVPCLDHLLALKLHVLKQGLPHRTTKDAQDVEMLIRRNSVNLLDPRYERLFLKYGTRDIYETFVRVVRRF